MGLIEASVERERPAGSVVAIACPECGVLIGGQRRTVVHRVLFSRLPIVCARGSFALPLTVMVPELFR